MDYLEIIRARHSVRQYLDKKIENEDIKFLRKVVDEINKESNLRLMLFFDEPFCVKGLLFSNFVNAKNYLCIVGPKYLEEEAGYYGEKFVLEAQKKGINTCFVGFAINKTNHVYHNDEKVLIVITFGYGENQGKERPLRKEDEIFTLLGAKPKFYDRGVEAVLRAPSAMNKQGYKFTVCDDLVVAKVKNYPFSKVDLGIAKYNFEIVTGVKVK